MIHKRWGTLLLVLDSLSVYLPKNASFAPKILNHLFFSENTNLKLPPSCSFLRSKRLERECWAIQRTIAIQNDLHVLLCYLVSNRSSNI